MLYRAFPMIPGAPPTKEGGALFVPQLLQGDGRHDNAGFYAALYVSRTPESPVAELLKDIRGQLLLPQHLTREGFPLALAAIGDDDLQDLVDLDDPRNLLERGLRPSGVATGNRDITQPLALALYRDGVTGFEWWSTIESSWINVTLFGDRAAGGLQLTGEPDVLTLDHGVVREAAEAVGVRLAPG